MMAEKTRTGSRPQQVYTLLVEVGRKPGDGLPERASGANLVCFAAGVDEDEAVREAVVVLKSADMAVLSVTGYGALDERRAEGDEIDPEEESLMSRALSESAVIVAEVTPLYEREKGG